jgi:hypothetical protein
MALAEYEEGASSSILAEYKQVADLRREDVQIPRLSLANGMSTAVTQGTAKPGQWLVTGNAKPFDAVSVIPLAWTRRRELRTSDFSLMCSSKNAEVGEGEPGGDCNTCPMHDWTKNGEEKIPPLCTFIYSYIVYVKETQSLAMLDFKRMSIKPGKELNTIVGQRGFGKAAVTLTSQGIKNRKGTFFIPKITPISLPQEDFDSAHKAMRG